MSGDSDTSDRDGSDSPGEDEDRAGARRRLFEQQRKPIPPEPEHESPVPPDQSSEQD
jgi:hypothetical protein